MSPSTTVDVEPIDLDLAREKFGALRDALRGELYEKDAEIDAILVALVSGTHLVTIGVPGVAKTMTQDRTIIRIDGGVHFKTQLRKSMPDIALFGGIRLSRLKFDEVTYNTDGFLPGCHTARLDEAFKASSVNLNGMLAVLLEREFPNGSVMQPCPLHCALLASNELPAHDAEENLRAFWDRIDQRLESAPPADGASWRAIARLRPVKNPPKIITWDEVLAAHADSLTLPVTDEFFDALDEIRHKLADESITMSPRRYNRQQYLAAARAWLDGDSEVLARHLEVAVNTLWDEPDQARTVERVVLAVVSPGQRAALATSDTVAEYADAVAEVLGMDPDKRGGAPNELFNKGKRIRAEIDTALPQLTGRARRTVEDADKMFMHAHGELLRECFGLNPDAIAGLS